MGGISLWQIAIVVIIIAILFGGKRLRNLGGDLGASLKGFKKAMKDDEEPKKTAHLTSQSSEDSQSESKQSQAADATSSDKNQ